MWWVDTAVPAGPAVADLDVAVGAAQQGNADAFRVLYRDTQPGLLRYLCALAGDDAEDVASETWLQVARDLPRRLQRLPRLGRHHRPPSCTG
jgi:RNA polymerase sigma-70 factor (ECF subfamily)